MLYRVKKPNGVAALFFDQVAQEVVEPLIMLLPDLFDVSDNLCVRAIEKRAPHGTFTNCLPGVGDVKLGKV
jgi:hypothetical protein